MVINWATRPVDATPFVRPLLDPFLAPAHLDPLGGGV